MMFIHLFQSEMILFVLWCASALAQEPQRSSPSGYDGPQRFHPRSPWHLTPPKVPEPERTPPQSRAQAKQSFQPPLAWRFPDPPVEESRFPPQFELREPVPADSVRVMCGDASVRVETKKDLLGIGKPILASDILLGDCPPNEEAAELQLLVFHYGLHECDSQLTMSEESFVYRFTLHYTPSAVGASPIVRTREVSINVECQYPRKHDVSSIDLKPTWIPYLATQASGESLYFSLKLMTDDWQFERPSSQFYLGDLLNVEASVAQFYHAPLRVFLDRCVATLIPNTDTVPRYSFIDNNGCLMDAKVTGSSSRFLPRVQDDKLQFQLEAFRFQQDNSGVIYITCHLRATTKENPITVTNKACSFINGWREASGGHNACSCCDSSCGSEGPSALLNPGAQWGSEMAVGPITVEERPIKMTY